VALGAATGGGFQAMVEFTAPVFWLFFLLTGVALLRAAPCARRTPSGRSGAAVSAAAGIDVDDPGCLLDLDTPDDFERPG
jgi:hypothetical protein